MALNNATHQPKNQDSILMSSNNMRHKHRLRNLLKTCLTTSTLAFMLSGGTEVGAANLNVTGDVVALRDNQVDVSLTDQANAGNHKFHNGDRLIVGNAAFNITTGGNVNINQIQNREPYLLLIMP